MRHVSLNPDHRYARIKALEQVWDALGSYRENCIPEGQEARFDEEWNYICEAMDLIHTVLDIKQEDV